MLFTEEKLTVEKIHLLGHSHLLPTQPSSKQRLLSRARLGARASARARSRARASFCAAKDGRSRPLVFNVKKVFCQYTRQNWIFSCSVASIRCVYPSRCLLKANVIVNF